MVLVVVVTEVDGCLLLEATRRPFLLPVVVLCVFWLVVAVVNLVARAAKPFMDDAAAVAAADAVVVFAEDVVDAVVERRRSLVWFACFGLAADPGGVVNSLLLSSFEVVVVVEMPRLKNLSTSMWLLIVAAAVCVG